MVSTEYVSAEALTAALATIGQAPSSAGSVDLIVRRPTAEAREVLTVGHLDPGDGLRGDNWLERGSRHTSDGSAEPDRQITLMGARAIEAIAGSTDRWPLAGDQLYVDLDLSTDNLPPGSTIRVGGAIIEVTAAPHRGCAKFAKRFGPQAAQFVNSPDGRVLNLRGINARVMTEGAVAQGDAAVVQSRPDHADA